MSPMTEYGAFGCLLFGGILGAILTALIVAMIIEVRKQKSTEPRRMKLEKSEFEKILESTKEARSISAFRAVVNQMEYWFELDHFKGE